MMADAEKPRVDSANVRKIIDFKPTPRHGRQILLVEANSGGRGYILQAEFQLSSHGQALVPGFWDCFATPKQSKPSPSGPDSTASTSTLNLMIHMAISEINFGMLISRPRQGHDLTAY
ncbi:hypothetical protein FVER14953_20391 [Fusarium verticillioides]|nr:hypothetical protein FVER14953_20391 [Fusarium verticillioides]